jgi:hypothetical protein
MGCLWIQGNQAACWFNRNLAGFKLFNLTLTVPKFLGGVLRPPPPKELEQGAEAAKWRDLYDDLELKTVKYPDGKL